MRAIASHSRFTFRYTVLLGAVFVTAWTLSVSTSRDCASGAAKLTGKASAPAGSSRHARWYQLGRASWYGSEFQGQATASGEAFDMYRMTCAHRSLPLGALVRVTNLRNHKSVVVRVNDRGPIMPSRVVDLSYAAARVIGFHGTTRVRLDLIDPAPTADEVARLTWPDQVHP